jgi:L-asparaginase
MRNPTVAGADGPANVLAAVQVAASSAAAGLGTLVVANDEIHAARFVRKTHSTNPSTFQSPSAGPIGWVNEGRARIVFRVSRLRAGLRGVGGAIAPVALLTSVIGDDGRLITTVEGLGYEGLVLEAFGGGHVPAMVMPVLSALAERLPVVLASRTGGGEVLRETYGFAGSERDMLSRGLISAGFLDGPKARVLLSLLLSHGLDRESVKLAFDEFNDSITSFDE